MTVTKFNKNCCCCCIQACWAAALKTKTNSGITCFQESKDYGQQFNKSMHYISTIDSCQCEQAIEPSATINDLECSSSTPSLNASLSDSTPTNSIEPDETPTNKKKQKIFVPDRDQKKKNENQRKCCLSNGNSNELLKFLKEESAKQARQDEIFLNLMMAVVNNNQMQQGPSIPQWLWQAISQKSH